jgi:hypothetical protein
MMMCAANKMIPDVIKMIRQTRDLWKSRLSYAVSHCGEISHDKKQVVWRIEKNVQFVDLCSTNKKTVFGMDPHYARRRLRGFFCKVGALIASPFQQTMVVDLDVVWMQQPDRLFESRYFQRTGSLFFRDRVYHFKKKEHSKIRINVEDIIPFFEQHGVQVTRSSANRMAFENGVSLFWLHVAGRLNNSNANSSTAIVKQIMQGEVDPRYPFLSEYQDSSVVMLDSTRHPKLLRTLEYHLPSFGFGYGDKELFWVAATISGEPFTFEPFLAGQYGDCYGVVLHYHPDDADLVDVSQAKPLYLNAEYFVEKELTCVGEFVRTRMTLPRLANASALLLDSRTYEKPQDVAEAQNYSCTCNRLGCVEYPPVMNRYLMYVQWLTLSASLKHPAAGSGGGEWPCVPVSVAHHEAVNDLFLYNITSQAPALPITQTMGTTSTSTTTTSNTTITSAANEEHCYNMGCPYLPIALNMSLPWVAHKARYCEPVRFKHSADTSSLNVHAVVTINSTSTSPTIPINTTTTSISATTSSTAAVAAVGQSEPSSSTTATNNQGLSKQFEEAVFEARSPHSKWNRPIYPERTVFHLAGTNRFYLYQGNRTHLIPNLSTFQKLGLDFSSAIVIPGYKLFNLPVGLEMPPM